MEAKLSKDDKGMKKEEERRFERAGDDDQNKKDEYDGMGKGREMIRQSLIRNTPPNKEDVEKNESVAQQCDDILAFSRSVNTTDSSLH